MSFSLPERLWEEAPVRMGTLVKKKHAQRGARIKNRTVIRRKALKGWDHYGDGCGDLRALFKPLNLGGGFFL